MVAPRGLRQEGPVVLEPLMAQLVNTGRSEMEPLGSGGRIQWAVIEGGEDFLDVKRRNTVR